MTTLKRVPLPDINGIEALANQLYPLLIARHAPCPGSLGQCAECKCGVTEEFFSCTDCFTLHWYCKTCIVKLHSHNPFHRVHKWNKDLQCKESTSLANLGLTIQLIHEDGKPCHSSGKNRNLQVLHLNGIHHVKYYQCDCNVSNTHSQSATPERLMANGLFPATYTTPALAFTFQTLAFFDTLNLNGHVNIKQFCDSIISNVPEDLKSQDVSK
jgi:hypothetical protein